MEDLTSLQARQPACPGIRLLHARPPVLACLTVGTSTDVCSEFELLHKQMKGFLPSVVTFIKLPPKVSIESCCYVLSARKVAVMVISQSVWGHSNDHKFLDKRRVDLEVQYCVLLVILPLCFIVVQP